MKYYTVYETVNKETGQSYRGKHITDNPYDGYLGSGKYLKRAIKKHGVDNFSKFVLYVFDNIEDMNKKEAELVNDEYLRSGNTYNLKLGGQGGFDHIYSSPSIATDVGKRGYLAGLAKFTSAKRSEIGKKSYDKNIALWIKSTDPEIMKRRSEIAGNSFRGRHHTKETRKQQKESQLKINRNGENNPNYGNCWIYSNDEKKSQQVKKDDIQQWLDNGWIKGRKIKF